MTPVDTGSERTTVGFGVTEVTLGKGALTLDLPLAQNEKQEDGPLPIFGIKLTTSLVLN